MNIHFLNRQNKLNVKLSSHHDSLTDDSLHWFGMAIFQNNDKLNKKVYKLAPRRNKNENDRMMKRISKEFGISGVDHLTQILADLNDDHTLLK